MSATLDLYWHIGLGKFVASPTRPTPVALPLFYRQDRVPVNLTVLDADPATRSGVLTRTFSGQAAVLGIGTLANVTALAETAALAWDADHSRFSGLLNLYTEQMESAVTGASANALTATFYFNITAGPEVTDESASGLAACSVSKVIKTASSGLPNNVTDSQFATLLAAAFQDTNSAKWSRVGNKLQANPRYLLTATTTDDTLTELLMADESRITLANWTAMTFRAMVVGHCQNNLGRVWNSSCDAGGAADVACSADGTKVVAVFATSLSDGYIYTSTDGGVTWTRRSSAGQRNWSLVCGSSDGTKLYAIPVDDGIYISNDSGASWGSAVAVRSYHGIACSSDGTKLVAVSGANVYTSADSGATWTLRSGAWGGDVSLDLMHQVCAVSASGSVIYLATRQHSSDLARVRKSVDGGATWFAVLSESSDLVNCVGCSPDGLRVVVGYLNGVVRYSSDGGVTWGQSADVPWGGTPNWCAVRCTDDGVVVIATGAVLAVSDDGGAYFHMTTPAGSFHLALTEAGTKVFAVNRNQSAPAVNRSEGSTLPTQACHFTGTAERRYGAASTRVTQQANSLNEPPVVDVQLSADQTSGAIAIKASSRDAAHTWKWSAQVDTVEIAL